MSEYHDYKEMYLTMVRETEKAINILIQAQQKCEELYLNTEKPDIKLLGLAEMEKKDIDASNK